MNRISSSQAADATDQAYRVELPRVSDAVGVALRDAYAREPRLPADMAEILRQLNGFRAH